MTITEALRLSKENSKTYWRQPRNYRARLMVKYSQGEYEYKYLTADDLMADDWREYTEEDLNNDLRKEEKIETPALPWEQVTKPSTPINGADFMIGIGELKIVRITQIDEINWSIECEYTPKV